jgi:hypothetical protein
LKESAVWTSLSCDKAVKEARILPSSYERSENVRGGRRNPSGLAATFGPVSL